MHSKLKIAGAIALLVSIGLPVVHAQSLPGIRQQWEQGELYAAKEMADNYCASHPNDAAGLLLKARVYNSVSNDVQYKELQADSRTTAFQSLIAAIQLDAKLVGAELEAEDFNLVTSIYTGYTSDGIALFNAAAETQQKDLYDKALACFKKAAQVNLLLLQHKWGGSLPDACNLYYTALSAIYAGNEEESLRASMAIADNKLLFEIPDKDFEPAYQWLVYYCKQKKLAAALEKFTSTATSLFPHSPYFLLNYIDWQREQQQYNSMFATYNQLLVNFPQYRLNFYQDIFRCVYNEGWQGNVKDTLLNGLPQFVQKQPANAAARLLLARCYFNEAVRLQQQPGRKNEVKQLLELSVAQSKYVVTQLPAAEKNIIEASTSILIAGLKALNKKAEAVLYSRL
jgi:tetratricopeptide (TPR) repeat protein